ncbi:MAG: hypothetical protein ACRC10_00925 [Thermoguttaceae bacterium]
MKKFAISLLVLLCICFVSHIGPAAEVAQSHATKFVAKIYPLLTDYFELEVIPRPRTWLRRASGFYDELKSELDARTETTTAKNYPARPFMGPALGKSMTYLELLKFGDSLQKGG